MIARSNIIYANTHSSTTHKTNTRHSGVEQCPSLTGALWGEWNVLQTYNVYIFKQNTHTQILHIYIYMHSIYNTKQTKQPAGQSDHVYLGIGMLDAVTWCALSAKLARHFLTWIVCGECEFIRKGNRDARNRCRLDINATESTPHYTLIITSKQSLFSP